MTSVVENSFAVDETLRGPIAVVGAGNLISHVFRAPTEYGYRFSIARMTRQHIDAELNEGDLANLINLCHVLTFAILDDGWITTESRGELQSLLMKLESLLGANNDETG